MQGDSFGIGSQLKMFCLALTVYLQCEQCLLSVAFFKVPSLKGHARGCSSDVENRQLHIQVERQQREDVVNINHPKGMG